MACNNECRVCCRAVYSQSVTVVNATLVIDIPARTYTNGERFCLFVIQSIPDTATINMPVVISIGGDTATVYPLTRCDCAQVIACAIRTRHRYSVRVATTATGGVFKVLSGLSCAPDNTLAAIPVATAPATPANNAARAAVTKGGTEK